MFNIRGKGIPGNDYCYDPVCKSSGECDESNDYCDGMRPILKYAENSDGIHKFSILQITDIHFGEENYKDEKTYAALDKILSSENPDLIILSGDQITFEDATKKGAFCYYEVLAQKLKKKGVPFALIFGNTDVENVDEVDGIPKTTRKMLVDFHNTHQLSLTRSGPEGVPGETNYFLDVYHNDKVASRIFLFDTGGGNLEEIDGSEHIDWFKKNNDLSIPVIVFHHIPTEDSIFEYDSDRCKGFHEANTISAVKYNAGLYRALADAGNVKLLGFGHNHQNGFCCKGEVGEVDFCFGRRSGYGGVKPGYEKGARLYTFELDSSGTFSGWKSHVRMESTDIEDTFNPSDFDILQNY